MIAGGGNGGEVVISALGALLGILGIGAAVGAFAFGLIGAGTFFVTLGLIIAFIGAIVALSALLFDCDIEAMVLTMLATIFLSALFVALSFLTAGIGALLWAIFSAIVLYGLGAGFHYACNK